MKNKQKIQSGTQERNTEKNNRNGFKVSEALSASLPCKKEHPCFASIPVRGSEREREKDRDAVRRRGLVIDDEGDSFLSVTSLMMEGEGKKTVYLD